jgi:hypothetical protein
MPEAMITFPRGDEFAENCNMICQWHPRLTGTFGSIDGLTLPVQEASNPEVENATYNRWKSWKSSHFISNVLAFSPHGAHAFLWTYMFSLMKLAGTIITCILNAEAGTTHVLQGQFLNNFEHKHQMDIILLPTQHFCAELHLLLGKSRHLSRVGPLFQAIMESRPSFLHSTTNCSLTIRWPSGGCMQFRGHLAVSLSLF